MSIDREANLATEQMRRHIQALTVKDRNGDTLYDRIDHERRGHPRAASWDNGPKATQVWCELHQQDVRSCHQETWGCVGVPLLGRSDPTGDAAMTDDPASGDLHNAKKVWRRICNDLALLASIGESYPSPHAANAWERQQTADDNDPRCESCARIEQAKGIPYWSAPQINGSGKPYRTTRNGKLKEPMYLCDWCDQHVGRKGCLPNEAELTQRKDTKRVICPHDDVKEVAA